MKKVLHISKYYPPYFGGVEQVAYDVVNALKGEYEQRVLAFNNSKKTVEEEFEGIKVKRVGINFEIYSQAFSLKYYKELKKVLKVFKPDVIHLHVPNIFTAFLLSKVKFDGNIVVHWHSDIVKQEKLKIFYGGIERKILKKSKIIIATSENYLKQSNTIREYSDKVEILPNIVDENKLDKSKKNIKLENELKEKHKNKKILFFLGRHTLYKGLDYLIEAADYIEKDAVILIAGSGEETERLKQKAKNKSNIVFLGKLPQEDIITYLLNSYLFVFPSISKNEAFGVALAEALYMGLPAVCFNIEGSGVPWVNQDNFTGFNVENGNISKFAEAVNILMNDNELRNKFSQNAKLWVKENFMFEKFSNDMKKMYGKF